MDHPGVYVPPPFVYVAIFFSSIFIQHIYPLDHSVFTTAGMQITAGILLALGLLLLFTSLWRFVVSKNTLIPIKPAQSLQTTGVYAVTRNPMYLALLCIYCSMAIFKGNWWTFIMAPIVILIIQSYVIKREEGYLTRAFGDVFITYKKKVRRWI